METFIYISAVFGIVAFLGAIWRPFKALAILMEAKARHWNALATIEEQKIKSNR